MNRSEYFSGFIVEMFKIIAKTDCAIKGVHNVSQFLLLRKTAIMNSENT